MYTISKTKEKKSNEIEPDTHHLLWQCVSQKHCYSGIRHCLIKLSHLTLLICETALAFTELIWSGLVAGSLQAEVNTLLWVMLTSDHRKGQLDVVFL